VVGITPQLPYPWVRSSVQDAEWAYSPLWMGMETLAPHMDSVPGPSSP